MKKYGIAFLILLAFCGCVTQDQLDRAERSAMHDDHVLWVHVKELEKEVRDLRRGYFVVPIKVSITNDWESREWREGACSIKTLEIRK